MAMFLSQHPRIGAGAVLLAIPPGENAIGWLTGGRPLGTPKSIR